jgi:hypothetical protein
VETSGIFSLVKITADESDLLLSYLRNTSKSSALDFIVYLIGDDYLKFLDLLAGTTFKVPPRKSLYRDVEYIKIYNYVKARDFDIYAIKNASKVYGKNLAFIRRALEKVSKSIGEPLPINLKEYNFTNIGVLGEISNPSEDKDSWAFEEIDDDSPPLSQK